MSESKERLTYRPEPESRQKIEQWYEVDNCSSMNELVERTVESYSEESIGAKPRPNRNPV